MSGAGNTNYSGRPLGGMMQGKAPGQPNFGPQVRVNNQNQAVPGPLPRVNYQGFPYGPARRVNNQNPPIKGMGMGGQPGSVYDTSASLFNQAAAGPNIEQFMNPFQQQVTDNTLSSLERMRRMQGRQIGAQAQAAGAYGGSRHGVADALTNEAFARQGAETMGNLNMAGFNTALGAAQQQQGIQSQLAGQGFGFGQQIGQQQQQQGAQQQMVMQALIDAARGQFGGFSGAPQQALALPMAALGAANMGQNTQTTQQRPGLFNILSAGLGLL
jgi:hypothetical protein